MQDTNHKLTALDALERTIALHKLGTAAVGKAIAHDPSFMTRMRDPDKTINTNTLDNVWKFILKHQTKEK